MFSAPPLRGGALISVSLKQFLMGTSIFCKMSFPGVLPDDAHQRFQMVFAIDRMFSLLYNSVTDGWRPCFAAAAKYTSVRTNLKEYCDTAYVDGETEIVVC